MKTFIHTGLPIAILLSSTVAIPFTSSNPSRQQRLRRDIPTIPDRPSGVGPNSFHGSQFAAFDDIGFVSGSPGVEAAPVFLYSRTDSSDVSFIESQLMIISLFLSPPGPPGLVTMLLDALPL